MLRSSSTSAIVGIFLFIPFDVSCRIGMKVEQIVATDIEAADLKGERQMEQAKIDSLVETRRLLLANQTATLSVLDPETSGPYGALVNFAVAGRVQPVILVSSLSRHTQALLKDPRASLMVQSPLPAKGDPLTELRATITGSFTKNTDADVRAAYLQRHPYAELYANFGDFSFWMMQPEKLYVVAGFGRVYSFDFQNLVDA